MKKLIFICLLALVAAGCVSKKASQAKARAAFLAGQQQAAASQAGANSVWVVGNVKTPAIPWTEDLTLARALIAAEYQGAGDPGQIVVLRHGSPPRYVSAKQLLAGFDMPLQAGDRVEVRP